MRAYGTIIRRITVIIQRQSEIIYTLQKNPPNHFGEFLGTHRTLRVIPGIEPVTKPKEKKGHHIPGLLKSIALLTASMISPTVARASTAFIMASMQFSLGLSLTWDSSASRVRFTGSWGLFFL